MRGMLGDDGRAWFETCPYAGLWGEGGLAWVERGSPPSKPSSASRGKGEEGRGVPSPQSSPRTLRARKRDTFRGIVSFVDEILRRGASSE